MQPVLYDLSPSQMVLAIDACKVAYRRLFSKLPGATLYEEPGLCWFETDSQLGLYNGVIQTTLTVETLPTVIERMLAHFRQRQTSFQWHIGPSSQPAELGALLQASGIHYDESEPGMAVDLFMLDETIARSSAVTIQMVTDSDLLRQWLEIWLYNVPIHIFEQCRVVHSQIQALPGIQDTFRLYLALLNGKPVAISALFLGAGMAAIEHVVTLPAVRRQGIGAAITLKTAQEARAMGYRFGVLTASSMGINTYRRLGFREYCMFSWYEWHSA